MRDMAELIARAANNCLQFQSIRRFRLAGGLLVCEIAGQ